MSDVRDFMEKPHTVHKCGKNIHEAKKSLVAAFKTTADGNEDAEREQFGRLLNIIGLAPKGAEVLKELETLGYTFGFERGNFGGLCNPVRKQILINPESDMNYMMEAIVHEGTHALQASRKKAGFPMTEEMTPAALIKYNRAIEADASAHQAAFVWQMKDLRPDMFASAKNATESNKAFFAEMASSGDEKKAMKASFKAWYDDASYRNFYDASYETLIQRVSDYGSQNYDPNCFSAPVPTKDVLDICQYKGKSYIEKDFLETGLAYSIPVSKRAEMQQSVNRYADSVGLKPDTSLMKMATRDCMGNIIQDVQKNVVQFKSQQER